MLASFVLKAVMAAAALSPAAAAGPPAAGRTAAPASTPVTPQFRRYGVADGLPSGAVNAVAQDRNGMMWFASEVGLVRYDGVGFKVFRHVPGDPRSIPSGPQFMLFVDRANRVWVGGLTTGLLVYDQRSRAFRQWLHRDGQPSSLAGNEVWSVAQTPDGRLWVASDGGLQRMRPDESGFDSLPFDVDGRHAASFGPTRALLAEPDGRLWIGAQSGLYVREPDGVVHRVPVDPAFHGDVGKVWHIDGRRGDVRVAENSGLLVIGADGVARPLAPGQLASVRTLSSTRDRAGRLWIASADGVWLQDGPGPLKRLLGQPLLPGGLPGNKTWQSLLDREGGLWVAFDESSVAYLSPGWDGFTRYTHVPDDPASLSGTVAVSVLPGRDGKLWVGGENGWIDRLDIRTGEVQHVVTGVHGQIMTLAEDTRGRLWINVPGGVQLFDHGRLRSIDLASAGLHRPVLLTLGADGRVYVASWSEGLFAIDPQSLAVSRLTEPAGAHADAQPEQLSMEAGQMWYASSDGLMHWDAAKGGLRFVPGVSRGGVDGAAFDAGGFWTIDEHWLDHYRYAAGAATRDRHVDIRQQPFAADFRSMRVDRRHQLWLFGNPGLWRFDAASGKFVAYGVAQGLLNAQFSASPSVIEPDGSMLVPNSDGVIAFQPAHLQQQQPSPVPPPLTLARVSIRRDGHEQQLPSTGGTLQLGWLDRDLVVQARLASYIDPDANRYRFDLRGIDSGWVDVDARGEREFAGLPAGDYTLAVRGAGADGVWATLAAPLRIHVQSPPWMRWWAWLAYALLLLGAIGLVLRGWRRRLAQRHRMQLIEQQRQLAEAASAAKTQFLATLSHEIRTPMTGVMGMAELLLSTPLSPLQHDYTRAMQRSGGMLLKLLNDALDLARIEAGRLELEPAPFDPRQLVEEVSQLEQGLAYSKGIRIVLELAADLPPRLVGDALRIKQVLLNLANNALKFTSHGTVTLSARRSASGLCFSVSDTGPGIPEASQARLFQRFEQEQGPQRSAGSGLGLAICRELVEVMGGSIELESRLAHGSTFHVRLPLPTPPAEPAPACPEAVHRALNLLLVEDDSIVAAVIGGLLEQQGHAACHVGNGLAALAELAHSRFDAVLLDLDLPGVDGFQIARLIRQREHAGEHLPIVAVTARSGSEDEARARAAGMDGFLRKPLSGEQLAAALQSIMATAEVADPA